MKCEESFPVDLAAPEEKGAKPAVLKSMEEAVIQTHGIEAPNMNLSRYISCCIQEYLIQTMLLA